jgi:hypothetical protein
LARSPDKLRTLVAASTEAVRGDVLAPSSLDAALQGVQTAYYLVHLMSGPLISSSKIGKRPKTSLKLPTAPVCSGSSNLGGLGDDADPKLSPHPRSRHEVGEILRESGIETIEFRAGMVIGAGSLSYPHSVASMWPRSFDRGKSIRSKNRRVLSKLQCGRDLSTAER